MINLLENFQRLKNKKVTNLGLDQSGKIEYAINNQGFRSFKDYVDSPDYAFFGCSLILGIGVNQNNIISSYFENSHNYGLATKYTNQNIHDTVNNFLNSNLYSKNTIFVIVWCDKNDSDNIPEYIKNLNKITNKILNFKVGYKNINSVELLPRQIDTDVSGTHPGPKSHKLWAYYIKKLLETSA